MRGELIRKSLGATSAMLVLLASVAPLPTQGGWPKKVSSNTAKLAESIDKLEMHIEQYGSVVPKQPDVWGQARLAKYRRMVEEELLKQQGEFKQTINATIQRSDNASFVNSLAIQAAISGPRAIVTKRSGTTVVNNATPAVATPATAPVDPEVIEQEAAVAVRDLINDVLQDQGRGPILENFNREVSGVALEPTVVLDQMTNYLNHLNQLRRTNEGDDTADSPGYALHLVRIPVSVLPGKKTQQGYGAEITLTAEPVIGENLLPTVFRSLITNEVVDIAAATMHDLLKAPAPEKPVQSATESSECFEVRKRDYQDLLEGKVPAMPSPLPAPPVEIEAVTPAESQRMLQDKTNYEQKVQTYSREMKKYEIGMKYAASPWRGKYQLGRSAATAAQGGNDNNPTRSADEIFSPKMFVSLSALAKQQSIPSSGESTIKSGLILDLRKVAKRHVEAAYALLRAPGNANLWSWANTSLLSAIQNNNQTEVDKQRNTFVRELYRLAHGLPFDDGAEDDQEDDQPVVAMAWAIIYASTLLNDQLIDDMKDVAAATGRQCHPGDMLWEFFLPAPMPEARELFGNYVRARWPIHVFAIDPMTEDQNVADSFSRRREMQLALSMAFTSGRIGVQSFMRFARRLDLDLNTIALNRTQVGFSHGNDTFGWRFYPRVQSPPIDSNATVFFRDLLVGGPSRACEMNSMRLEQGARECVALVIMPSFVPYVRFDSRTNWFKLSNPKHKEFDLKQDVELGTQVTCLREASIACQNDDCVRGTDLALLMRSVDQLEHRLPLQTCLSQVPFELTDSGHTLFNNGVTDLGPRIRGYYGEPGGEGRDISIAIVGENFSVTETKVIAGNVLLRNDPEANPPVNQVSLLSRQVLVVTIPWNAISENGTIDLHVATPYGVSNHLDVRIPQPPQPGPVWTMRPQAANATYVIKDVVVPDNSDAKPFVFDCVSYTPAVLVKFSGVIPIAPDFVNVTFLFDQYGPLTVRARKVSGFGYTVDIKSLARLVLGRLVADSQIDRAQLPESLTITLRPVSVTVNPGEDPMEIDGALTLRFRPQPAVKPAGAQGIAVEALDSEAPPTPMP